MTDKRCGSGKTEIERLRNKTITDKRCGSGKTEIERLRNKRKFEVRIYVVTWLKLFQLAPLQRARLPTLLEENGLSCAHSLSYATYM